VIRAAASPSAVAAPARPESRLATSAAIPPVSSKLGTTTRAIVAGAIRPAAGTGSPARTSTAAANPSHTVSRAASVRSQVTGAAASMTSGGSVPGAAMNPARLPSPVAARAAAVVVAPGPMPGASFQAASSTIPAQPAVTRASHPIGRGRAR
jgi:hypothetical protein